MPARLEAFDKSAKPLAAELSLDRVLLRIVALKDWANAKYGTYPAARDDGEGGVSKGGLSAMSTSAELRVGVTPAGYTRDPRELPPGGLRLFVNP
jgi:hypothetical protein